MSNTPTTARKLTWKDTVKSLSQPKVAVMAGLGFSAGLPFLLVGNTLGFWLREAGITLTTIGFLSWVGLAYSFKFLWAPLVDKVDAPLVGSWLGRRRGWMFLAQLLIAIALVGMATLKPEGGLMLFTGLAFLAAFGSATQDIVVDAWRIEISDNSEEMALLSSSYQLGYRAALLVTESLILIMAQKMGWSFSYYIMGAAMLVGLISTFVAREPKRSEVGAANVVRAQTSGMGNFARRIYDAIAGPFIVFFKQYGKHAFWILAAISLYRLPDFVMGPMANPFYADLGKLANAVPGAEQIEMLTVVGTLRASVGIFGSIAGVVCAGLCAVRFGFRTTFLLGAFLGPASNIGFTVLAYTGARQDVLAAVMAVDAFATGFAGTALVGFMSSLTTLGYTATQYALLSSFYTILGKFLKGLSGATVESLAVGRDLMSAYGIFFFGTAVVGVPALILCWILVRNWDETAAAANKPVA